MLTSTVETALRNTLVRNLRAFADDADYYGMTDEEQNDMYNLADRLEAGTADEADWLEALEQMDCTT